MLTQKVLLLFSAFLTATVSSEPLPNDDFVEKGTFVFTYSVSKRQVDSGLIQYFDPILVETYPGTIVFEKDEYVQTDNIIKQVNFDLDYSLKEITYLIDELSLKEESFAQMVEQNNHNHSARFQIEVDGTEAPFGVYVLLLNGQNVTEYTLDLTITKNEYFENNYEVKYYTFSDGYYSAEYFENYDVFDQYLTQEGFN